MVLRVRTLDATQSLCRVLAPTARERRRPVHRPSRTLTPPPCTSLVSQGTGALAGQLDPARFARPPLTVVALDALQTLERAASGGSTAG